MVQDEIKYKNLLKFLPVLNDFFEKYNESFELTNPNEKYTYKIEMPDFLAENIKGVIKKETRVLKRGLKVS